uniref:Uncharacterized protein n=1 Tax=Craspedostauros australis TaxID=1486917 RepID=A0A7S0F590_9STRA|mmetsp:Transcript_6643/g.18039  ORF Transcript_6643/g.18039 Transcript_6643/m.18039 type:complete len:202 (+) Transcript_6643:5-610(+)
MQMLRCERRYIFFDRCNCHTFACPLPPNHLLSGAHTYLFATRCMAPYAMKCESTTYRENGMPMEEGDIDPSLRMVRWVKIRNIRKNPQKYRVTELQQFRTMQSNLLVNNETSSMTDADSLHSACMANQASMATANADQSHLSQQQHQRCEIEMQQQQQQERHEIEKALSKAERLDDSCHSWVAISQFENIGLCVDAPKISN